MFSIRRSCQSALQTSRYVCLYAHGARRAFSHSPAHSRGALPNFLPPSSPELSSLLSTFNSKVLLPYHLTKEQQKLVYSQEARAKLEAEPVEITLGDVTLPLEHLDRNKLPDRWYTLRDIVKNSETKEDWENVVRCLEGFEEAGIKVKWQWQSMVVRRLNFAGMQHLVLKAIQRPKATGIRLSNWDVLVQVLRTVHDQAAMTNWEQEDTMKALKMANQVVELMENKEHCGGQITPTKGHGDWRGHPAVIALPTEMAAVVAEKYGGDKEAVKKMANRLVAAIKQNDYMATVDSITTHLTQSPGDFQNIPSMSGSVLDYCHELFELTVVWNALKTSRKVLGANMPSATEAQQYEAKLEQAIMDGVNKLKNLKAPNGEPFESEMGEYIVEMVSMCK